MMVFYRLTTMPEMLRTFGAAQVFVTSPPVNSIILVDTGLDAFVMDLRNLILIVHHVVAASDSEAFAVADCMHV